MHKHTLRVAYGRTARQGPLNRRKFTRVGRYCCCGYWQPDSTVQTYRMTGVALGYDKEGNAAYGTVAAQRVGAAPGEPTLNYTMRIDALKEALPGCTKWQPGRLINITTEGNEVVSVEPA